MPHNFGKSDPCKYGCQEDMSNFHIFTCRNPEKIEVEKLNYGNGKEKVEALRIFQKNLTNFFVEEIWTIKIEEWHEANNDIFEKSTPGFIHM